MTFCLICFSKTPKEIYQKKDFSILKCQCGLIFSLPLPSEKELREFYSQADYFRFWGKLGRENIRRVRAIKRRTFFSFLLPLKKIRPRGRLLDVGCANGSLLQVAESFRWQGFGIEPSAELIQQAPKKIASRIFKGLLDDYQKKDEFFDIVIMFDVLEHLINPRAALEKVFRLLKPGGVLAISTPDAGSFFYRLLGPFWPHFKKEHLFYFKPTTIRRLLSETGFQVRKIKPTPKFLNIAYCTSYFQTFPFPVLTPLLEFCQMILPQRLLSFAFPMPTGNMTVISVKKKK